MNTHPCSIAGCDREAEVNGMCSAHFTAALVHGVFHTPSRRQPIAPASSSSQHVTA